MLCTKYLVAVSKNAKQFAHVRHSTTVVRSKASDLFVERFVRTSTNEVMYYSYVEIYKLNLQDKTCSCRWFMAYASCQHKVRGFELFDIQDAVAVFQFRKKPGKKSEKEKSDAATAVAAAATQSIVESTGRAYDLSQLQLIKLSTLLKAYYYTLYMTESKHLIQTQLQYRLPLLVTFKKNNYTWNGLMDSIA